MVAVQPRDEAVYADCTFGRGGHARALLARGGPHTRVIALDRDPDAVRAGNAMAAEDSRLTVVHAAFSELGAVAARQQLRFDAV